MEDQDKQLDYWKNLAIQRQQENNHLAYLVLKNRHLAMRLENVQRSTAWQLTRIIERAVFSIFSKNYRARNAYGRFIRSLQNWINGKDPSKKVLDENPIPAVSPKFLLKKPLISLVLAVHGIGKERLEQTIRSVEKQAYENWELCVVEAGSNSETITYLKSLDNPKVRVEFSSEKSTAGNRALSMAQGEYVGVLNGDDALTTDALYEIVRAINHHDPELIYSDEKIGAQIYHKPDYSPDMLLSQDYMSCFSVFKRALLIKTNGFREAFANAASYDLILRLVEKTNKIHHVAKVLYSRDEETQALNDREIRKKAVEEALQRQNIEAEVLLTDIPGALRVKRKILGHPLISIIIPFKDRADLLRKCIFSVLEKSTYDHFEIIGINNKSTEKQTFALMEELTKKDHRVKFYHFAEDFNYSKINNYGVSLAKGEHLILLNGDTEVISKDWMESMLEHSQRSEVGAVGAKLYYPNNTIQHAGVILGLNKGVADHIYKGLPISDSGYFNRASIIQNLSAITAACLMVKKKLYEDMQGLEENHFRVSFNDIDFCLRLREAGYLNVFTPYAELYHHESVYRGADDTVEKLKRAEQEADSLLQRHSWFLLKGDPYHNINLL
jgi:glycosyltransferase involved in cell wall biosynthesis